MNEISPMIDLLRDEGASLVLEYGSSVRNPDSANDIDLFAIFGSETPARENLRLGDFEVIRLSKDEFRYFRNVLNPVHCTEPLLKGEVRYGPASTFTELRQDILSSEPTPAAVRHNLRRSYEEFWKAVAFVSQDRLTAATETLTFAVSYRLFAKWYSEGKAPARLDHIREASATSLPTGAVFTALERTKSGDEVTKEQLTTLLDALADGIPEVSPRHLWARRI